MAETQEKLQESPESGKQKKPRNPARSKKLKYGGIATAITCTVTAVVILVNILVSVLVEKYPLKLDLTEDAKFEISQESIDKNFILDSNVVLRAIVRNSCSGLGIQ